MKGDFSSWRDERRRNFNGVLHQQGRVLLDADWNAQTAINNDWQDTAAEDIIGAGVAAVPSDKPNGFKVTSAIHSLGDNNVQLKVTPGRVWADGLLTQLYGEPDPDSSNDVTRVATYLKPPVQDPAFDESTINTNVRDAVVLEVWREEINGFQIPETLIEPALGGPDTTERVHTAMAFRLMRLGPNDTCENIRGRLQDDFSKKGKLKVTLKPTNPGSGDCPVVAGGGYTGFEHNIYRIEIANVKSGPPQFKWSQYAGGLVGRGHFDNAKKEVTIKANLQAITNSGLTSFYVEAVEYDEDLGHWRVTYGANATLNNNILSLGVENFGAIPNNPQPTDTTFFRLWNGVALVQDFASTELPNNVGILLDFEAPAASNYVPGDYWTFPVRAGEIANNEILIDKKAPQGIHYHRVPLAVLSWADTQNTLLPIEDCRHIFHPLTRLATCCSYRVGDGMHSWGDFDKIQDAIDNLPAGGGEICILPGEYEENVVIKNRQNITLKGCGVRSRVVTATAANAGTSDPVIHIYESQNIKIESLGIFAHNKGVGVQLEGPDMQQGLQGGTLRDITLNKLYIEAATRCAIQCHIGFAVTIQGCDIEMSDEPSDAVGIFLTGDDCFIKENIIRVISSRVKGVGIGGGRTLDTHLFEPAVAGRGGIQIGGTSERVLISHNLIQGGISHGIILGSLLKVEEGGGSTTDIPGGDGVIDKCDPCHDTNTHEEDDENSTTTTISAGALYDIYIKHNLIYNMGANGISVINFFDLEEKDEFITVERLTIGNNEIRNCLLRNIQEIPQKMLNSMGYGGIALADVEYLVIHDNLIENNGPNHLMPICGIYVLHGEGIEISRNRIINNGANNGLPAEGAHSGARGGIYINYAIAPRVPFLPQLDIVPVQNGVPAFRAHDNIVSAPLGQALFLVALGPVSVVGNQFTTLGVLGMRNFSLSWIATTVLIFNLGLSNELYFQLLAFWVVALGQIKSKDKYVLDGDTLVAPKEGLDDQNLGQYLANGNVLFSDNQVTVNLIDKIQEFALSSILIASLDDVSFHGNQCDCDLMLGDFIFTHSILFGISVRVEDNRFKEGILGAWLSAITLGLLNMTTDNQSTHCLMILGWKVVNSPNSVLLDAFYRDDACGAFRGIGNDFGQKPGQTQSGQNTPAGGANPTINTNNANQAYTVRAYK